jgi:hypothetical protein
VVRALKSYAMCFVRVDLHSKKNSVALGPKPTIPTERPLIHDEVSVKFYGEKGVVWSALRVRTAVNLGFLDRWTFIIAFKFTG